MLWGDLRPGDLIIFEANKDEGLLVLSAIRDGDSLTFTSLIMWSMPGSRHSKIVVWRGIPGGERMIAYKCVSRTCNE